MAANQISVKRQPAADAEMLVQAIEDGDESGVADLLAVGADVNAPLSNGQTALMVAATKGYFNIAKILLAAGADINARRKDGFTPLYAATFFGHENIVRLLVDEGADVSAKTLLGSTAKSWASSRGFTEIAKLLGDAETNNRTAIVQANQPTGEGESPREFASTEATSIAASIEPSTKHGVTESVITPVEPETVVASESVAEELNNGAQAEAGDETANIKEARLHAEEVSVETESANDFNETVDDVTIASVRPVESLPTALPSPKFSTDKRKAEVFTSVEDMLSHYVAAAPLEVPEIASGERLSGKDHRLESLQPDVNTIGLEPEAFQLSVTQPKRDVHLWGIGAVALIVALISGFITYTILQRRNQPLTERQTVNNESSVEDSINQPAQTVQSTKAITAASRLKEPRATARDATVRQHDEVPRESIQNLDKKRGTPAAPQDQLKTGASNSRLSAPVNSGRNAARSSKQDALPQTAKAEQRKANSSSLASSKRGVRRQSVTAPTGTSSSNAVSGKSASLPNNPPPPTKKKVINWP